MTMLYRTYRPRTFAEVSGQEHVKRTLAQEVAEGNVAHAYLFTGPRGVGKTTVARILAKAVNCTGRKSGGDPCDACDSCLAIGEGSAVDVIEIDAASHTGVENVREQIIENARFAPTRLARKVFIVDEVHMLSTSAFNALLKTLEEPPSHAMFVLATTDLQKLPATVVSRCQRFDFRRIGREDMLARLRDLLAREGAEADDAALEAVVRESEGCLRDAESLLTQLLALGEKRLTLEVAGLVMPLVPARAVAELVEALLARDVRAALAVLDRLSASGADPARIAADLADAFRLRALEAARAGQPSGEAAYLLRRILAARDEMRRLDQPEIALELAAVEWCRQEGNMKLEIRNSKSEEGDKHDPPPAATGDQVAAPLQQAGTALETVRTRWNDILRAAQGRNHGLPYMLGAAELLDYDGKILTIGFQYALYRDRLNDRKYREVLEAALAEVLSARVGVKAVLVAQKTDGLVEPAPSMTVTAAAKLPDGFAELVKEFGGTVSG